MSQVNSNFVLSIVSYNCKYLIPISIPTHPPTSAMRDVSGYAKYV